MRFGLAALVMLLLVSGCGGDAPEPDGAQAVQPPIGFERAAAAGPDEVRLIAHGARLARVLGCQGCHGADLTGHIWEDDPDFAVLYTSNLTRVLPGYSDAALERAIRLGVRADGSPLWAMPSEIFTHLAAEDMTALTAYLRTLPPAGEDHPRIAIGPAGRAAIERGELRPTPEYVAENRALGPLALDGGHDQARYMTRATCAECHSIDLTGEVATPDNDSPPPDLIVVGAYTRGQFHHLLRTGEPVGERELELMAEVSRGRFAHFTDGEVDAIYDYLIARAGVER
ncbi:MAG: c-type cytochrome [Sphingomonadaceae bacterium]|nr:c-type cytochrome [Sphingomonadaceae bacterium]